MYLHFCQIFPVKYEDVSENIETGAITSSEVEKKNVKKN